MSKCLVVLSGGQDSTTCLFLAKEQFDEVHAISFDYGQNHVIELQSAAKIANMADVDSFEIINIRNTLISSSPLTQGGLGLERYESAEQMESVIGNRVEHTFVPMRNLLFLTIAVNRAVSLNCTHIYTGICQEDNANYPDCTDNFRTLFEDTANIALGLEPLKTGALRIIAPLMNLSKEESVKLAYNTSGAWEALAYSHTSYDGKYPPTDMNHANILRADGFKKAGLPDPLVIRAWNEGLMELPLTNNYRASRSLLEL
ncbi:COG0603 Predicted PP-loop superfamily ATPase [uncultured Caudovirales phage]|uniref:7-cyano-7-deazaguanine synthase n=1 Tax=uncultured Caudovirales phage TaxID=2100421 RepID=A0A6J7X7S2_9CAUD|nr:COG0603 Predicted PP-loop superfamily ATPase [uncultured Caudovirales phage]CAB5226730.1 COG0603 Predicted PP-loop superfamily ATPase [uncultured Caudovirales phage]